MSATQPPRDVLHAQLPSFDSTRDEFDSVTPAIWGPAGQSLAFALELEAGQSVLDVCAGTGASAIPTARAVGPNGLVHAVDLADDLLEIGRVKATAAALRNIDFVCADATEWEAPSTVEGGYDALSCSYGSSSCPTWTSRSRASSAWSVPAGGSE